MKLLLSLLAFLILTLTKASDPIEGTTYGFDVSFPIHYRVSTNYPDLPHNADPASNPRPVQYDDAPLQTLGNRHQLYLDHLKGCRDAYPGSQWCDRYEFDRLLMNRRQPVSMENYTETGFRKIRAPQHVVDLVSEFWETNKDRGQPEQWGEGNLYLNHWNSPPKLVSVDDKGLRGSGAKLKKEIWAAAAATLETWTSQELQPVALYGIRVYQRGAIMLPHVDRLPLVSSAMLCVATDVEEPWPFEMYDHVTQQAHNVTLEPGEMLLFESHSVIHGHPFPLKGNYQAMIFLHFEPTGHPLVYDDKRSGFKRIDQEYRQSVKEGVGGQSSASNGSLPPYIQRSSPEEAHWRQMHPQGWNPPYEELPSNAHIAAMKGNLEDLVEELLKDPDETKKILEAKDENGWQLLHHGIVSGSQEIVEFLVKQGAEINARTHSGYGETPLRMAEERYGDKHPIVTFLTKMGALSLGPEL